MAPCAQN